LRLCAHAFAASASLNWRGVDAGVMSNTYLTLAVHPWILSRMVFVPPSENRRMKLRD
jgi:hypothetical protein